MSAKTLFKRWLLFAALFVSACDREKRDEYPEYFSKHIERLKIETNQTKSAALLDSFYADLQKYPSGIDDWVEFYKRKGSYYNINRNFEKLLPYYDSIMFLVRDRLQEEKYKKLYLINLFGKSECCFSMKNYDDQIKYWLQAKTFMREENITECIGFNFNEVAANMFYKQQRYSTAIEYYKKAIETGLQCQEDSFYQFSLTQGYLDNIGLAYSELDMRDSAIHFYNEALQYINSNEHRFPRKKSDIAISRAVIFGNLAKGERELHKYAEAERLNMLCIQGVENADNAIALHARFELANTYLDWGKPNDALRILNELNTINDVHEQFDIWDKAMLWNKSMKRLSLIKKDTNSAYNYEKKYLSLKDSVDKIEQISLLQNLDFDMEKKQQLAIATLLQSEGQTKSTQLLLVSLLIAIASICALLVWHNLWRTNKRASELQALNNELHLKRQDLKSALAASRQIHNDNMRVKRIVAHDLKNPIGGVRNLLYSFSKKQSPGEVKNAMEAMNKDCNNCINIVNNLIKEEVHG